MTQCQSLLQLLQDGRPHRTDEILESVYGGSHLGLARLGARVWDLKKRGLEIIGWHDPDNRTLYWYHLVGVNKTMGGKLEHGKQKSTAINPTGPKPTGKYADTAPAAQQLTLLEVPQRQVTQWD